jgi:hypothetical protein
MYYLRNGEKTPGQHGELANRVVDAAREQPSTAASPFVVQVLSLRGDGSSDEQVEAPGMRFAPLSSWANPIAPKVVLNSFRTVFLYLPALHCGQRDRVRHDPDGLSDLLPIVPGHASSRSLDGLVLVVPFLLKDADAVGDASSRHPLPKPGLREGAVTTAIHARAMGSDQCKHFMQVLVHVRTP